MARAADFADTFATLRGILTPFARRLLVQVDTPTEYQLASRTQRDRIGRPLFVAAVQIKKNYVSYHLMPVYAVPELAKALSPGLRKRMQGKSCFNFTTLEPSHIKELEALTSKGLKRFEKIKLPWEKPKV